MRHSGLDGKPLPTITEDLMYATQRDCLRLSSGAEISIETLCANKTINRAGTYRDRSSILDYHTMHPTALKGSPRPSDSAVVPPSC